MSEGLFEAFDSVSAKQWKQKIQAELKGADYNEALVWQSAEGIHVKPFYHPDDFKKPFPPIPGQPASWQITQQIFIDDEAITNRIALDAIERGAEAILFSAEKEFSEKAVFANFPFDVITIYFDLSFLSEDFLKKINSFLSAKKAKVHYNIDPIGNLARSGNWFSGLKQDHTILQKLLTQQPKENILGIDTALYQNAGANSIQQLAYGLAHANEYLNYINGLDNRETLLQDIRCTFIMAMGSNYFFEIAKLRALRKLYASLANAYGASTECHLLASPSKRNKTLYDYNVNMLRTTTECMSAILGGADAVRNIPYDVLYHKSNEFGERIARNQLLILKAESYFDAVSNPSDGAYYIESLTTELAEKALALFKTIEAGGGFLQELKAGTIQRKIKESAEKEQQLYNAGKLKLLGTNYHTNPEDRMKDELDLYPFVKTKARKTLIQPIIERRLAEKTEQERLSHE
jgi:methylmalonyl-CoA mutase